jgi:hypothetical protein
VESKAKLDEDVEADKRQAEDDALCAALRASLATVQTSNPNPVTLPTATPVVKRITGA